MKLSPLAEIKRDELARQHGLNCKMDHAELDFKEGFSAGYAFAREEDLKTVQKLIAIFKKPKRTSELLLAEILGIAPELASAVLEGAFESVVEEIEAHFGVNQESQGVKE